MVDRNELIEEMTLRKVIRKIVEKSNIDQNKQDLLEEKYLRKLIQKAILFEKAAVGDDTPHEKTGINVLRKTLKKIIPQIKDDYMSLTTDPKQRESYIAHLINGMDNLLAPIEANMDAPEPSSDLEEDVEIKIGSEDDKFIDVGDLGLGGEEPEEEEAPAPEIDDDEATMTSGMEDSEHDATGRNVALGTFKQIQGTVVDDFGELANDEDRELYHDYLKTNILLYKDKFEDSLSSNLPAPTTATYEKEKDHLEGGTEEEELVEIYI
tara:strand:+ start:1065 stop:1862 length:798 start_codon:yes stop_codon:yes gene_type:complete